METTEQNALTAADRRKVKTPMTGTTTDDKLLMLSTNPNSFMLYSKFICRISLSVQLVSCVIKTAYKIKINLWIDCAYVRIIRAYNERSLVFQTTKIFYHVRCVISQPVARTSWRITCSALTYPKKPNTGASIVRSGRKIKSKFFPLKNLLTLPPGY